MVTPCMGKSMGEFKTQVARRLTSKILLRKTDRTWKYTSAAAARKAAGFLTMEEYIRRCHNTVTHYIATRSMLDLCEGSERAPGVRGRMRWWEQEVIDLTGAREATEAVAEEEGGEE